MKQQLHTLNYYNSAVSECLSDKDDLDKIEYELNDDVHSEFSNDDDKEMMIDFLRLRPVNGHDVGGTWQPADGRRITCSAHGPVFDQTLFEQQNQLARQQESRIAVEYENCNEREDCGDDDQDKDNGLDSTFCLSLAGDQLK